LRIMQISSKTLIGVLTVLFVVLFVVSTVLAFALYNVEQNAFDADLYIRALNEENVYQRLPELTAQALSIAAQRPERNGMLSLFRNLSDQEWQTLVTELFPPDVLRNMAADTITQIMAYLNGQSNQVVLSLANLKTYLQSPEGINAVYGMLKVQPDCTVEQLTAMALNQQALTLCNPPETFMFVNLRPIIETEIKGVMALIPERVIIVSTNGSRVQTLQDLKDFRLFMRLSPLVPMLCLLAITALVVRSLNSWLTWWGYPLLIDGLVSMSLSVLSGPMTSVMFRLFIVPALPEALPPDMVSVFQDLTATIVRDAVQSVLLVAGIMVLIGLIMVALTFLLRKRLQQTQS
jgi:hypothetical protein